MIIIYILSCAIWALASISATQDAPEPSVYIKAVTTNGQYDMEGTASENAESFDRQLKTMRDQIDTAQPALQDAIEGFNNLDVSDSRAKPEETAVVQRIHAEFGLPTTVTSRRYTDAITAHDIDTELIIRDSIEAIQSTFEQIYSLDISSVHTFLYDIDQTRMIKRHIDKIIEFVEPANTENSASLLQRLKRKNFLQCDYYVYEGIAKTIYDVILKGQMMYDIHNELMKAGTGPSLKAKVEQLRETLKHYPVDCTTNFRPHAEQTIMYTLKPRGYDPLRRTRRTMEQVSRLIYRKLTDQFSWLEWTVIVYAPTSNHGHGYRGSHYLRRQPIHFLDLSAYHDFPMMNIVVGWSRKDSEDRRFLNTANNHCPRFFGVENGPNVAEITTFDAMHYAECAQHQYDFNSWNLIHVYRCACPSSGCDDCQYLSLRDRFVVQGCVLNDGADPNMANSSGCKLFQKHQVVTLSDNIRKEFMDYFTVCFDSTCCTHYSRSLSDHEECNAMLI